MPAGARSRAGSEISYADILMSHSATFFDEVVKVARQIDPASN